MIDGIQHELPHLVPALYQEDLIGDTIKDTANLVALTPMEKATKVVDALQARVKNKPSEFHKLVKVLRSNPVLSYLGDHLEKSGITGMYIISHMHWKRKDHCNRLSHSILNH